MTIGSHLKVDLTNRADLDRVELYVDGLSLSLHELLRFIAFIRTERKTVEELESIENEILG